MLKLNGYRGDMDLACGGFFWSMESVDSDYADIVRVVPASDMGGPDNLFFIEVGSLYLPGGDIEANALACCGWIDESQAIEPCDRVDSMIAYTGLDNRTQTVVQIGPNDAFYSEGRGFGMPTIDRFVSGKTDLRGFVLSEFVSFEVN